MAGGLLWSLPPSGGGLHASEPTEDDRAGRGDDQQSKVHVVGNQVVRRMSRQDQAGYHE